MYDNLSWWLVRSTILIKQELLLWYVFYDVYMNDLGMKKYLYSVGFLHAELNVLVEKFNIFVHFTTD